jgi:hypothetical protein
VNDFLSFTMVEKPGRIDGLMALMASYRDVGWVVG